MSTLAAEKWWAMAPAPNKQSVWFLMAGPDCMASEYKDCSFVDEFWFHAGLWRLDRVGTVSMRVAR